MIAKLHYKQFSIIMQVEWNNTTDRNAWIDYKFLVINLISYTILIKGMSAN